MVLSTHRLVDLFCLERHSIGPLVGFPSGYAFGLMVAYHWQRLGILGALSPLSWEKVSVLVRLRPGTEVVIGHGCNDWISWMSSQMSSIHQCLLLTWMYYIQTCLDCRYYTFPSSSLAQAIPVTLQMDEVDHNLVTELFADFFRRQSPFLLMFICIFGQLTLLKLT